MPSPPPTHEPILTVSRSGKVTLPNEYALVRKGNVYITKNCRKLTQEAGQTVYTIQSATKTSIGIAVPTSIYAQVQKLNDETSADRAAAVAKKDATVKDAFEVELLRLFPKAPIANVDLIVRHTLKKRSGRVGRTTKLDLDKVVILAVRAHIRHKLTEYDALLRSGVDREQARKDVQRTIDDVAREWRGVKKVVTKPQNKVVLKAKEVAKTKPKKMIPKVITTKVEKKQVLKKTKPSTINKAKRGQGVELASRAEEAAFKLAGTMLQGPRTTSATSATQPPRRRSLRIEELQSAQASEDIWDIDDLMDLD
ncbi:hypothetical protein OHC33_004439 [Knufia fluminis]|uniref:DUF2293 domain-containing protein n=1 Tax=Knufia fluminis TaxID=191047 RepID=A0AAN8EIE5_9EURO|nr:hypothetical protein OHC33_004439 [Knufia fluminis]